jgi:hypothetical protein
LSNRRSTSARRTARSHARPGTEEVAELGRIHSEILDVLEEVRGGKP